MLPHGGCPRGPRVAPGPACRRSKSTLPSHHPGLTRGCVVVFGCRTALLFQETGVPAVLLSRVSRSRSERILVEVRNLGHLGDPVILTSAVPSACDFGRPVTDTQTTTTHGETAPLVMAGTLMAEQCRPRMIGILMKKVQRWPLGTRTDDSCAQPSNPQPTGCDRVLTWRRGVPSQ